MGLRARPACLQLDCHGVKAADLATSPALGDRPWWPGMPGSAGIVGAWLETAGRDDLLLVANPDGEGARSAVQHLVGAIVGPLLRRYDSAAAHPDKEGAQEACWELVWQLLAQIMFARQRKCTSIYDLQKIL